MRRIAAWLVGAMMLALFGGAGLSLLARTPVAGIGAAAAMEVARAAPHSVKPTPTRAEVAGLQTQADAACRCSSARNRPNDEQCWGDYRRSVARFEITGGWSTACMEESTATDCFGPEGPNQLCVRTQRMYNACSDAEQRARVAEARRRRSRGCSG